METALNPSKSYSLFECIGIELEYMIVDNNTLAPQSISDEIIKQKAGEITDEIDNGAISWSNELVMHVVELKTTLPVQKVNGLSKLFHQNVVEINNLLKPFDACLLGTAIHPLLNPDKDIKLWPHHNKAIYEEYNKIFDCKGHGWGNLQSMHINLPFANDWEFYVLHESIRHLMPLIPALTASSPIYDGKVGQGLDNRLLFYEENQKRIPSITGKVIPESVKKRSHYQNQILDKIYKDIAPYDSNLLLQHEWLNSRGAITRFDRNAIEIRIIDLQESPRMDLSIAELVMKSLQYLVPKMESYKPLHEIDLYEIYKDGVIKGKKSKIQNLDYLALFGIKKPIAVTELWKHIIDKIQLSSEAAGGIDYIIQHGNLAERILHNLKQGDFNKNDLITAFKELATCLNENKIYQIHL